MLEVHVAGDRGHDGEAVERDALEAPAVDLPRQQRFAAGRRRFTVDDAAAGEDFRRPGLDVGAFYRDAARAETRGHEACQHRRHEYSSHGVSTCCGAPPPAASRRFSALAAGSWRQPGFSTILSEFGRS